MEIRLYSYEVNEKYNNLTQKERFYRNLDRYRSENDFRRKYEGNSSKNFDILTISLSINILYNDFDSSTKLYFQICIYLNF